MDEKKMMAEGAGVTGGHAVKKPYPSGASIVALRFPDGISKKIYSDTKGIPGALKEGDHHVTMAYLGNDLDDETKMRVRRAVKMYAANTPALTGGSLNNGTGTFKRKEHGQPFYANFQAKGLYKMRDGLNDALGKEGIKMAGKPFVPHVTLAYLPDGTQSPQLDMDQDGLQFDALHLKMGGGEYEAFPLTGETKGYDLGGHVDAVRNAWQAKMRDRHGNDWWEKGYTVETVEDDAIITKKGGKAYRCPYTIEDGRVRFGDMQAGALQFVATGEPGEYKMCSPDHARKMYMKTNSDNRVLDVADGNVIFEDKAGKCFRSRYSGDGDDVKFGKPVPVKVSFAEMDEDEGETKAGRRMAAPNISKLETIKESLSDAVAKINQFLLWNKYAEGTGKSFPDWLDLDALAEWIEPAAALKSIDIPPMYLKAISEKKDTIVVGGYMMPFGAPYARDLQGDYATKATEFYLDYYDKAPALYHHGKNEVVKGVVLGHRDDARIDEDGLWVQDELKKAGRFWAMINALLDRKALYYSPGSAPHLVKRTPDRELKVFPIVEDTLTPTPVLAPLLGQERSLEYIKSAYKDAGLELTFPDGLGEGAGKAPMSANGRTQEQELALAMLKLKQQSMEVLF